MANDGLHRNGKPLTDAEFRAAAEHMWLNALCYIHPTQEQLADIGREVLRMLSDTNLTTTPLGRYKGSPAIVLYVNKS